jgi:hypothetical protein
MYPQITYVILSFMKEIVQNPKKGYISSSDF